jgi:hypothetical protein
MHEYNKIKNISNINYSMEIREIDIKQKAKKHKIKFKLINKKNKKTNK